MSDFAPAEVVIGALALACAIFYAAWHEYRARNRRDSKLLAAVGTASLIGSAVAWLY